MEYRPVQTTPFSLKIKIKGRIWLIINKSIFRYSPFFMRKFRVALINLFGGKVDWSCSLHRLSKIEHPWNLQMGKLSSLGENSWAYCLDKIIIGEKCCIGKDVYLLTGSHDLESVNFDLLTKKIEIKDGVWISTGCYILPGIVLGEYSVVAAGSVVIKNVDSKSIVGGNPAKVIKERNLI